jgi:hypothetical protein
MSERCCWPHCTSLRDTVYLGKSLCDKHCDMIMSEDTKAAEKARKKIGLPPCPEFSGRAPTHEECYSMRCCFPDCSSPISAFVKMPEGELPFCCDHFSQRHDLKDYKPPPKVVLEEEEDCDLEQLAASLEGGAYDWDED